MFAIFLPALNFRGNRSPYLWLFHKLLSHYGNQAAYICGEEYFLDSDELLALGRPEANDALCKRLQYKLPDRATLNKQLRIDIPLEEWLALENRFNANPLAAFKYYCLEEDERFFLAINDALNQTIRRSAALEAVITCVNCASLQKVCRDRNLRLIHLELGPLRPPDYLQSAYFDFTGVNGGSESLSRFIHANHGATFQDEWASVTLLRALLMVPRMDTLPPPEIDLGIGLQIEDDSNQLCFSNGFTAHSLIVHAQQKLTRGDIAPPVLVRSHPGSFFKVRALPVGLESDQSTSSSEFVLRCRRIDTINSGIAVEAFILERWVHIHGDSPFGFCNPTGSNECDVDALAFFLLNYLVPWSLAFQPEYARWRLQNPNELDIRQRHLEAFMRDKLRVLDVRIAELELALAERERELAQIRASIAWRLAFPVWKALRPMLRWIGYYMK